LDTCTSLSFHNDTAPTQLYTLSLHDALPISNQRGIAAEAFHACPSTAIRLTRSIHSVPEMRLSNMRLGGRATRTTASRVLGPVLNSSCRGDQFRVPVTGSLSTDSREASFASQIWNRGPESVVRPWART